MWKSNLKAMKEIAYSIRSPARPKYGSEADLSTMAQNPYALDPNLGLELEADCTVLPQRIHAATL